MDFEQMQKIVDGAPEWAICWDRSANCYTDMWIDWDDVFIGWMRAELAKREPMDLRDVDIPHGTIVLEK